MLSGTAEPTVLCEEVGQSTGVITLNRPKALNAINLAMVRSIRVTLNSWKDRKSLVILKVHFEHLYLQDGLCAIMLLRAQDEGGLIHEDQVRRKPEDDQKFPKKGSVIRGAGEKSFCAGGDVLALVGNGQSEFSSNSIREEYSLVAFIASYKPDFVALIDGITMGGGVGIAVHGKYRVATERTVLAMPENAIGLFPDIGAGYLFPRLDGKLGLYLGLTGARLKGKDVVKTGIATHFVPSKDLGALENELVATANSTEVANALNKYNVMDHSEISFAKNMKQINECFSGATVEDIVANLEKDGSDWAHETLNILAKMSPTSLKITKKLFDLGTNYDLRSCLRTDFRITLHCIIDSDFKEGVRALLIDRDRNPKWNPSKLSAVTNQHVDRFFEPLPDGDKLVFEDEVKASL